MVSEDRKQILEMVANGKITIDDAARLLDAVEAPSQAPGGLVAESPTGRKARMIRVRVVEEGRQKVNINLPFGLAKIALGIAAKTAAHNEKLKDIDLEEIIRQVESGVNGKICEVVDDRTLVEIYVD